MAHPIQAAAPAMPADFGTTEFRDEERWPPGLTLAFAVASSVLLWLPIIAAIRWLLA